LNYVSSRPGLRVRADIPEAQPLPGRALVELGNDSSTATFQSDQWTVVTYRFVAQSSGTVLTLSNLEPGREVLVDNFQIRETGNTYYLPEESFRDLIGKSPDGRWTLEVWDNRVGGPITGSLLGWKLDFTLATPPSAQAKFKGVLISAQKAALSFSSQPGKNYELQTSTNLVNWESVTTVTAITTETTVEDPVTTTNKPAKFYRLREVD
jgi:subtilisin-like proprotein convertase family protein